MLQGLAAMGGLRPMGLDPSQRRSLGFPFLQHLPGLQGMAPLDRQQGFLRPHPLRRLHGTANNHERLEIRAWTRRKTLLDVL